MSVQVSTNGNEDEEPEPEEYFEDVIEEAAMFSAMGFGMGLFEQVIFDVATGSTPSVATPLDMMSGPFVV
ncbi:MAG: hypothetical protein ACP5RJ_09205, partial [Conexivisphaera sp.]